MHGFIRNSASRVGAEIQSRFDRAFLQAR